FYTLISLPLISTLFPYTTLFRSTSYLAQKAKEYIGIDYAIKMIELCGKKFQIPNTSFFHCDARDLSQFRSNYFDFIFFSFNGIRSEEHTSELQSLRHLVCRLLLE